MEFSDIFELLESVRVYQLRPRETLVPVTSVTGSRLGYSTADGDFAAVTWEIETKAAKATALARGTKESQVIRDLLSSHMGRKQLLEELRAGILSYGIARPPRPQESVSEPEPSGPRQCLIPGL